MSGRDASTPRLDAQDDRNAVVLGDFRLLFAWSGDRWAHALEAADGWGWAALASSLESRPGPDESTPVRDDPRRIVSPAYQQFHWQDDAGGRAMLLGQLGPHHFSAVFQVRRRATGVLVEVDVADRCRAVVDGLACTYTIHSSPSTLAEAGPLRAGWSLEEGRSLVLDTGEPATLSVAEAGRHRTHAQINAALVEGATTHRCTYCWQVSLPG